MTQASFISYTHAYTIHISEDEDNGTIYMAIIFIIV